MPALAAGLKLGRYVIEEVLGEGGMGEVYRARDLGLGRAVAIKILPDAFSADPARRERFEREARVVAALNHPHVCVIHDVGFSDGRSFLVLEYLEGETLAERLARGGRDPSGLHGAGSGIRTAQGMSLASVLTWSIQIADALAAAHRQGIVHRDLKPGNVMVTRAGVKLLDFGLARPSEEERDGAGGGAAAIRGSSAPTKLTTANNVVVGSLPYMAPEQLEGRAADARSDLFALGLVIYEMVAGRRPFAADTEAGLIAAVLEREPTPLLDLAPGIPPALDVLVSECLAKDPDERWQSAADLRRALQRIAAELAVTPGAGMRGRHRSPRRRWLAAGAVAALPIVAGAYWLSRPTAREAPAAATALPVHFEIAVPTLHGHPRLSPDGRKLLVTSGGDGRARKLFVRPLHANALVPVPGSEGARFPFWSPDGAEVAFSVGGRLKRVAVGADASSPRLVAEHPSPFTGGSWSPTGVIVFVAGKSEVFSVPASGGEPVRLPLPAAGPADLIRGEPSFLPDGRHFLYFEARQDRTRRGVMLASIDDPGRSRFLFPGDTTAVWAPGGMLLYGHRCGIWARTLAPGSLDVVGDPRLVTEPAACESLRGRPFHSVAANGALAYRESAATDVQFVWYNRAGAVVGRLNRPGQYLNFDLSPDEQRLVTARRDRSSGALGLWVFETKVEGSAEIGHNGDGTDLGDPVWTADGQSVVHTDQSSLRAVMRRSVRGGPPELLYRPPAGIAYVEDVSRDGRSLAVLHWTEEAQVVKIVSLADETTRVLGPLNSRSDEAAFSPDGALVAYNAAHRGEGSRWEVYVERLPPGEGRWQVSASGGVSPRWAANGRKLVFLSLEGQLMEAQVGAGPDGALRISPAVALFDTPLRPNGLYDQLAVTNDGERFLLPVPVGESQGSVVQVILNWNADPGGGSRSPAPPLPASAAPGDR